MALNAPGTIYPLSALRALVLHTQRLTAPNGASPALTPDAIVDMMAALGCVQLDTLHVVNRAHYITLWARCGAYSIDDFTRLIYSPGQRRLYEGWGHAASIIPLEHYRYHRWRVSSGSRQWLEKDGNRELAQQTLERIRSEGGLRVGDFEYSGPQRGAWFDWKPPKMALEVLFALGDLMVADRVNFQRVYDLSERVLPGWVDAAPAAPDEARRFCLEQAARALGVFEGAPSYLVRLYAVCACQAHRQGADRGRRAGRHPGPVDERRPSRGWCIAITCRCCRRAADGEIKPERTTFLAPFNSLFWAWERDQSLWGFRQRLECYLPAAQRIYGYFSLPILHKSRLVGRFDPKLERKTGMLRLNALYLEPGVEADDELVAGVAAAMRDFLAWHGAKDFQIEKSDPAAFGEKLLGAL